MQILNDKETRNKKFLNQKERLITGMLYFAVLVIMVIVAKLDFSTDESIWLFSGALLIIFGKYIVEPFFTKPADSFINTATIITVMLTISLKNKFLGYWFLFTTAVISIIFTVLAILLKDKDSKFSKFCNDISIWSGGYKFLSAIFYILASASYIYPKGLWLYVFTWIILFCFLYKDLIGEFILILTNIKKASIIDCMGKIVKVHSNDVYSVELCENKSVKVNDFLILVLADDIKRIGVVLKEYNLLNCKQVIVYCIEIEVDKEQLKEYKGKNLAFKYEFIEEDNFADKYKNFIGFVNSGSDINNINIDLLKNETLIEGSVVEVDVRDSKNIKKNVLYQVINGITNNKTIESENNINGVKVLARKIGWYGKKTDDGVEELQIAEWVPKNFEPVFLKECNDEAIAENTIKSGAIGRLPNTDIPIKISNHSELVTHNTAILGILGIGKSCLSYEIIKNIIENTDDIKIICIDITGRYEKELPEYIDNKKIIKSRGGSDNTEYNYPDERNYFGARQGESIIKEANKYYIDNIINKHMLMEIQSDNEARVLIVNPNDNTIHTSIKTGNSYYLGEMTESQKTRLIMEELLKNKMQPDHEKKIKEKILVVLEEAHSLIPEWNSTANDGDVTATNGTAKVIQQGRKYGLGCMLITQRTANVTKSILNQCNTIFAMRIFDETGQAFLSNYLSDEYASLLPNLKEREVIAIGRGLKLKQPVIMQVNDKDLLLKLNNKEKIESKDTKKHEKTGN